ncbi:MAG: PfkB family carbohydrate kinase, partial [Candidatus Aminicenantaceae bacterium]
FVDKKRPTTVKTRIIAHHQQIVRVDQEEKKSISSEMEEKIFNFIQEDEFEGILISDYNKGLLTKPLMQKLLLYTHKKGISVFVDPKVDNFFSFSPVTLINPNHTEAEQIVHHACDTDAQVEKAGKKILSRIEVRYMILKRGERGLTVFEKGKKEIHIPTIAKEVFDVTGAGDTVIATASLALLSDASILEAAMLANAAAGVVVGKIGTATVTPGELINALHL